MVNYISVNEFAKEVNRTASYIFKLIKQGKITPDAYIMKGKRYFLNSEYAKIDMKNNISYVNRKSTGTKDATLLEEQKKQAKYKAKLLELEYEEKSGSLVRADHVAKEFFNIARTTRDAILNIPDRISAELASMTDVHLVSEKLITSLTEALEELSR